MTDDTGDTPKLHGFDTLALPFEPGEWCDADERMFQACFTILGQFVEDELGREPWECTGGEETMYRGYRRHFEGDGNRKAIDLWLWYRDELPVIEADYAQDMSECYSGTMITEPVGDTGMRRVVSTGRVREPKFEYEWPEIVKDTKLRELMDLRRSLWT